MKRKRTSTADVPRGICLNLMPNSPFWINELLGN
nr:MAG TPA: hypothetical protein [Caudoviricetes sp.]